MALGLLACDAILLKPFVYYATRDAQFLRNLWQLVVAEPCSA